MSQPHGHTLATGVAVPEFGVDSDTMGDGISADGSRMYAARNFLHGVLEGTKWPGTRVRLRDIQNGNGRQRTSVVFFDSFVA